MLNAHRIIGNEGQRSGSARHVAHENGRAILFRVELNAFVNNPNIAFSVDVDGAKVFMGR